MGLKVIGNDPPISIEYTDNDDGIHLYNLLRRECQFPRQSHPQMHRQIGPAGRSVRTSRMRDKPARHGARQENGEERRDGEPAGTWIHGSSASWVDESAIMSSRSLFWALSRKSVIS